MIVYLVANIEGQNTGHGGHFYSVKQISQAMKTYEDTIVLTIGTRQAAVLENMSNAYFIPYDLSHNYRTIKDIDNLLRKITDSISVVHAYDFLSLYIGSVVAKNNNSIFVHTKCGGSLPKSYYPIVNHIILFHEADKEYFNKHASKENKISVIPNRVEYVSNNPSREDQIQELRSDGRFNILKVGRIGHAYYNTLIKSINLAAGLEAYNIPTQLIFIGYLESDLLLKNLYSLAEEKGVTLKVFTDKKYTNQASELLWAADAIVGNGRGAMEALSTGKIVLFTAKNSNYPYVLTPETASYAAYENFSERVLVPDHLSSYSSIEFIYSIITSSNESERLKAYSKKFFYDNYYIGNGAKKLMKIYKESYSSLNRISWSTKLKLKLKLKKIKLKSLIWRYRN